MAAAYAKPLQLKLQEAGLQGTLDADAFQALLKYVADAQGSLDSVYSILEQLKLGMRSILLKHLSTNLAKWITPADLAIMELFVHRQAFGVSRALLYAASVSKPPWQA